MGSLQVDKGGGKTWTGTAAGGRDVAELPSKGPMVQCCLDAPIKLRNKNPEYIRNRMMQRESALVKREHRKSAVELLEESKSLYVKSEEVLDQCQVARRPGSCHITQAELRRNGEVVNNQGVKVHNSREDKNNNFNSRNEEKWRSKHSIFPKAGAHYDTHISGSQESARLNAKKSYGYATAQTNSQSDVSSQTVKHHNLSSTVKARILAFETKTQKNQGAKCIDKTPCNGNTFHSPRIFKSLLKMSSGSDEEPSGFEASGYATILKRPKPGASSNDCKSDKSDSLPRENGSSSPRPVSDKEKWRDTTEDSGSDTAEGESEDALDDVVVLRKKQKDVSRSHSDLSQRLSSSSDWSELSARLSRNSADLEKFFNEMGLDRTVLDTVLSTQGSSRSASEMHLFESLSSIDSQEGRSVHSSDSKVSDTGVISGTTPGELPTSTSVVERNARIIKWLCTVRKTAIQPPKQSQVQQESAN